MTPTAATSTSDVAVAGTSRLRLHDLRMRLDGTEWIVGRIDTGDFVAMPEAGAQAIKLLGAGLTVDAAAQQLRANSNAVDLADFIQALVDLGFVAEVDGRPVDSRPGPRPSLPWLQPHHVRWTLSPVLHAAVGLLILAGLTVAAIRPELLPRPSDVLWTDKGSLVLIGQVTLIWLLIFLHELAHLGTARAAGIPGRIRLGTQLQFLVVQTDVSGVWSAPQRIRMTVYLAGCALNLAIAAGTILVLGVLDTPGGARHPLSIVVLGQVFLLIPQLLVFMRTDLYFVLQDLTGCRNLYADGSTYARYLARRLLRRTSGGIDPSQTLPAAERRAVRIYTVLLVVGTAACLAFALLVTLPVTVTLIARAVRTLAAGGGGLAALDAGVVLAAIVFFQGLWAWAWWRRHDTRVHRLLRRAPSLDG